MRVLSVTQPPYPMYTWTPQSPTGLWSIGPGWKMDGLGQDYPDTLGPGRRFPAQSEGVIVQKTKKFYVFFCISGHSEHFLFLGENLKKIYSKSQEDIPPPHNGKNILYLYFMFHAILSTFNIFWKNK